MGTKLKDYYDLDYAHFLAHKIKGIHTQFDEKRFIAMIMAKINFLEFGDRQILIAKSMNEAMNLGYEATIEIFKQILGPEIIGGLGMFTEGWWLWPIGKYVEMYGFDYFQVSTEFSKELTKRFTAEYCMRPIIEHHPKESMELLLEWSMDKNERVRRLASECMRIRLPWAKRMYVVLDHFETFSHILGNLRHDSDRSIMKSVANNLNDLYKEAPDKFEEIVFRWSKDTPSETSTWIIKHGSRSKKKEAD